ncbi:MAG: ABC transporter ATP-binding protein [Candidatus Thiodiazotropha sp. (ex Dulcina madagascariensis)]|nr:ABC transporter ATP-binding protein [Candidatus Thiodiazotropha sp. (ex Dulcina madagascariensis)]MCU7928245.1 ABC transporter ATP-binding protein [Candidatus Thiodiazotropha sp. (ex Dulcina madagascariensis)]
MPSLLTATKLSRSFHTTEVVEPLDLQLAARDILGLLGPNGAGKSTIMRMLSGDLSPSGGRIEICGHDLLLQPKQAKRHIGYLPERPPLHRDQSVDEFLSDCACLRGLTREQTRQARLAAKRRCGLEQTGRRLIRKLSKGFQQRVGLAQAIIHDPRVVILDEPTDGLDPAQIRQVRELIRELADERGVILSSHILPEIQATCNRLVILQQGKRVYSGEITPPEQLCYRLALEQNPDQALIAALPAVVSAERLHSDYFRVTLETGSRPSELVRQILEQGWGVCELTPETVSLEQLFLQATTGGEA